MRQLSSILSIVLIALGSIGTTSCNFSKFINYPEERPSVNRSKRPLPPITNANKEFSRKRLVYTVQPGDTIYSIAWAFEKDDQTLLKLNHLSENASLVVGQKILLQNAPAPKTSQTLSKNQPDLTPQKPKVIATPAPPKPAAKTTQLAVSNWHAPTKGTVTKLPGSLGVEILGEYNQAICAAQDGIVVYSGSGINYFDNLIIIKHHEQLMSAYGYNAKNLVKVGQKITAGQQIALMGYHHNRPTMYFELRQAGKPINPFNFIKFH